MSHYETNPISILITGFKRAFAHSQQLAIMLIVLPMILGVVNFFAQIFGNAFGAVFNTNQDRSSALLIVGVVLFLLALLLQMFTQILYVGFQAFAMIKISRGEDETFGKALEQAFSKFWKIVGVYITLFIYTLPYCVAITSLIVLNIILGSISTLSLAISLPISIIISIALIILIIRVYMRFAFAMNYLFDGAQTTTSAFDKSKHLTKGRLSEVFGVMTIGSMVPFVSALTTTAGMAVLFKQLTEAREAKAELPRQHLLNYLVPLLGLMFVGVIALIFVAIYAASSTV